MIPWNRGWRYKQRFFEDSEDWPLSSERVAPHLTRDVLLASRWRNLRWFGLIFVITFIWVMILLSYAYLSSFSSIPFAFLQTPARAVLAINLGSTVAMFLLAALAHEGFEILRWRLVMQRGGIGIATFLTLGRATTMGGVIRLLFSDQKVGHQKWCIQRIVLNLTHIFLGFLLLSNIDFQDTYATVGEKQDIIAGLAPLNTSIYVPDSSYLIFSDINSLLQSPQNSIPATSPNGSSCVECFSYLLPGTLNGIGILPNGTPPAAEATEGVTLYVSKAAPVYRLDYYPLTNIEFPPTACQVYGELVKICLMNVNEDLLAGWTACPFNDTTWKCDLPESEWINSNLTTVLHIRMSSLIADTVYNLKTGAIESVTPVHILGPALSNSSIQDLISTTINDYSFSDISGDVEPAALRNLVASAFYEYNWGTTWNQTSDAIPSMYVYGYYTVERFRLVISVYSLALFTILTVGELIWALLVLLFTSSGHLTPIRSGFPEWDFASKCVTVPQYQGDMGMGSLMRDLGSASSAEIMEQIKSKRIMVSRNERDRMMFITRRTEEFELRYM